jgi:hypothetical protein
MLPPFIMPIFWTRVDGCVDRGDWFLSIGHRNVDAAPGSLPIGHCNVDAATGSLSTKDSTSPRVLLCPHRA